MVASEKQSKRQFRTTAAVLVLSASALASCSAKNLPGRPVHRNEFRFNVHQLTHLDTLAKMGSLGLYEYRYEIGLNQAANPGHRQQPAPAKGPNSTSSLAPLKLHESLSSKGTHGFSYQLTPAAIPYIGMGATITVNETSTNPGNSFVEDAIFTNPNSNYFHDDSASISEISGFFKDPKTRLSRYLIRQDVSTSGKCQLAVELDTNPSNYHYAGLCSDIREPNSVTDLYHEVSDLLY